jgi:hypothetical protein
MNPEQRYKQIMKKSISSARKTKQEQKSKQNKQEQKSKQNKQENNYSNYVLTKEECDFLRNYCKKHSIKKVLEFGPGTSTRSLLDGDVKIVYSLEYNQDWFNIFKNEIKDDRVKLFHYDNKPYLSIEEIDEIYDFDLAFVDSPTGGFYKYYSRINSVLYSSYRTNKIAIHDANRKGEENTIKFMYDMGWRKSASFKRLIVLEKDNSKMKLLPRNERN